ncbi:MAG: DUF3500 domain-containing protein [Vicinamibacteraceae bacterium]
MQRVSRTYARPLFAALTIGFVFAIAPTGARETTTAKDMRDAATAFLSTLDAGQKTATTFAFTSDERENWFFTPVPRKGLAYFSMSDAQRAAAVKLLKTGLSAKGFSKVEAIRSLESILYESEGEAGKKPDWDGKPHRFPDRYLFTVFGTPSATEPWGWRFEGHHISQNWTVVSGTAIASSPQFFGSNPAEVRTGPKTGLRVLAAEEDLARTLLVSLDEKQRQAAMVDAKAPNDVLTTNKHKAERLPDVGVAYSELTPGQQQALWKLIEEYAFAQTASLGQARIATIKKDGVAAVKFAWMGVADKGGPHYYRVQGPRFAIEYDNTQNTNNHIHAVWRDYDGDFGRDILAEHYKADHGSAAPGRP